MNYFLSVVFFAVIAFIGVESAITDNSKQAMVSSSYGGGYGGSSSASYSAPAPAPAPSFGGSASSYSAPAPAPAPSYGGGTSLHSAPVAPAPSYSAPAPAPIPSFGGSAPSFSAPAATLPSYAAAVGYAQLASSLSSYPAPPCPKNYVFSCQPSLSPVACSDPSSSGGYGSAAAYSQYVPSYVLPPLGYAY